MDFIPIDTAIVLVAQEFGKELQKLRTRTARTSSWSSDHLTLHVDASGDGKIEFHLEFSGAQHAKASTLGALMDEVYRRSGFDDREAGKLQAASDALLSLPAPSPEAEASLNKKLNDEILF